MPFYHFRFVEDGGRIVEGEDHDCADDQAAQARAHAELRHGPYRRVEVWRGDRLVASLGTVDREPRGDPAVVSTQGANP
jgi:hypothetical protein